LGAKVSKLIGSGDYATSGETAINDLIKGCPDSSASFSSKGEVTRIRHREYIQDVVTGPVAGVFNNTALNINPGLASLFPYLASIAQNYEEYRIRGMVIEFVSSTSPYNTNGAMGTLILSMEYNPLAPPYTSKPQMENSAEAVSARFDKNMMYGVECSAFFQNMYLVRYQTASPLSAYDVGTFQFATAPASTFPVNSVVGELWVSYDVELMRPRISPARFGIMHYVGPTMGQSITTIPTGGAFQALFGTLSNVSRNGNVFTITDVIQGDAYQISVTNPVGGMTGSGCGITSTTGLAQLPILGESTLGTGGTYASVSTTSTAISNSTSVYFFTVTAVTGGAVTFTLFFTTATISSSNSIDVVVVDLGNGLTSGVL
jgi:hypothetical protein